MHCVRPDMTTCYYSLEQGLEVGDKVIVSFGQFGESMFFYAPVFPFAFAK